MVAVKLSWHKKEEFEDTILNTLKPKILITVKSWVNQKLHQTDFISTKCLCNLNLCKPSTCLSQTDFTVPSTKCLCNLNLCKPKTCLNQTDFTVSSTKCLCNLNLCKPNTCLNQTHFTLPSTKCVCNLNLCKPNNCLPWKPNFQSEQRWT